MTTNLLKINEKESIDLGTLIDTRLLIQANSGGGKSWLIRRLLEQSHGKVQQIIIDLEGEFHTLREKYDYILVSKEGDIKPEVKSAGLLAKKLLELNVSAVIDLYELNHLDRKKYARLFLEAMVNAPKELWHPVLVIIDEAHVFCPEKGQSEASEAVIDLATRGRKRGYCAVLATQRLSKLHKDAAAECNNKLIGRTGLDVDMKRASEELGFTSKEQYLSLRGLDPGEFFAFGPAVSKEVIKLRVGKVETTHPKAGSRILTSKPAPPTEKVKSVLSNLTDLSQAADEELKTIQDFQIKIQSLERELRVAKNGKPKPSIEEIDKAVKVALKAQTDNIREYVDDQEKRMELIEGLFKKFNLEISSLFTVKKIEYHLSPDIESVARTIETNEKKTTDFFISPEVGQNSSYTVTGGARRMLEVLAGRYPMKFTKNQLALLSRLSPNSGTTGTYFSSLKSNNLINVENGLVEITNEGIEKVGLQSRDYSDIVAMWSGALTGGARRMFDYLVTIYPESATKEDLATAVGLSSSSGTFGTYFSQLKSNNLVEYNNGQAKATSDLFI